MESPHTSLHLSLAIQGATSSPCAPTVMLSPDPEEYQEVLPFGAHG